MKTIKHLINSSIILLFILLSACTTTSDPAESYKGESATQIFNGGEDALRDKSYSEAIKRFEALNVQYPFSKNTETAELHLIYAYYMSNDYPATEAAADRFIHAHPMGAHVDYAYLLRGLANYYQNMGVFEHLFAVDFATRDLTQIKKSFSDFSTLVNRFPNSPYAPAAEQYMIYLRNVLANHQLEVAQFYYKHGAYVASANRASIVIENYEGSPIVPAALVMMAKSYHQLHQTQLENQVIAVLRYNYPDSSYLKEAQEEGQQFLAVPSVGNQKAKPKLKPIQTQARIQSNGSRGTGSLTLSDAFTQMSESDFFALHPKSTQKVPNNGQRSQEESSKLSDLLDKLGSSPLFAVHPKPGAKTASNPNPNQAPQQPTVTPPQYTQETNASEQANAAPENEVAPVVKQNNYPMAPGNGMRR